MTKYITAALCASLLVPAFPSASDAGSLGRACLNSGRDNSSYGMCRCIQKVANDSLSRADQKLAASFLTDPHKAQETRQSDRRSHEIFWKRYKAFGSNVTQSCKHLL